MTNDVPHGSYGCTYDLKPFGSSMMYTQDPDVSAGSTVDRLDRANVAGQLIRHILSVSPENYVKGTHWTPAQPLFALATC